MKKTHLGPTRHQPPAVVVHVDRGASDSEWIRESRCCRHPPRADVEIAQGYKRHAAFDPRCSTTRLRSWMTVRRAPPSVPSAVGAEAAVWLRSRTAPAWSKSGSVILTFIPRAPSSEQGGRPGAGAVSRWRRDALTDVLTRIAWGRLGLGCRVAPRSPLRS